MILELDMGNTRIKWRLQGESGKVAGGSLSSRFGWQELDSHINNVVINEAPHIEIPLPLRQVRAVSVLEDSRNQSFLEWCLTTYGIHVDFAVSQPAAVGVVNGYENPALLGVDRWLALLAGFTRVKQAAAVVDCGSAITVDLVTARGEHLGGYIGPGLAIMRQALLGSTQKVILKDTTATPTTVPGRNTDMAVTAALSAMMTGMVKEAVQQLEAQEAEPVLMITGGDAEVLRSFFPQALYIPELVLDGLALAIPCS